MLSRPYQLSMTWFEGVVESRLDPLELCRVQVRVFGIHTDNLAQIPSKDLIWMQVMHPTTSGALSGVSETPKLLEGTHVIGYFRDGDMCQDGIVLGSIAGIPQSSRNISKGFSDNRTNLSAAAVPGKPQNISYTNGTGVVVTENTRAPYPKYIDEPDISRLARGDNATLDTVLSAKIKSQATQKNIKTAGSGTFSEPNVPYKAKYPYNDVKETESGHVLEFDDTPAGERVHLAHRTGSFIEMHSNGDVVDKSAKDTYNIAQGSAYEHVEGTKSITIDKGMKLLVNADGGSSDLVIEVGSNGNLTIKVVGGDLNINVEGDMNTVCSGAFNVRAESINLN